MSEVVGVAEVIVRPVTTGFAAEARSGIQKEGRDIGRDLSKAILAGFAIGGVVEGIKSVVEAATKQNTAFAVLDRTLKDAGQSVRGFSASLHDTLEKEARATGVSAEDLAAAMTRLVPATKNAKKSLSDLTTAIGISQAYHISLSTAALALAKAETGSFTSLQRYLGLIPKVTTAQDALKARYTALSEAGSKLDASQKAQYEAALKVAKAQDLQATSQEAINRASAKFSGIPGLDSYQTDFNRLHVAVDQLKVAVGTELVGALAHGAGALADWIDKLVASDHVQEQVHRELQALRGGFLDIKSVVESLGPPVLSLTNNLGGFVRVLEILGGVLVARKFIAWAEGVGAAGAAETATAASTTALTEALAANTAALNANTVALGGDAAAVTRLGVVAEGSAAKVGLLSRAVGVLAKGLGVYLAANQAIKAFVPGQKDLGLDFSNNTAGFSGGANKSPYQKGSYQDSLYQRAYELTKGGKTKAAQDLLTHTIVNDSNSQDLLVVNAGFKAAGDAITKNGKLISEPLKKAVTDAATDTAKTAKTGTAKSALNQAAQTMMQNLRDGISTDKTDLAAIKTNLADTIKQGAQAVIDAVNQAKQNLNSIGSSLSTEIQAILVKPITDAQQQITEAQNKLTLATSKTTLSRLGQSVLLPGGKQLSSDPQRAIAQLQALEKKTGSPALTQFIQQYQSAFLSERSAGVTVASDRLTREGQTAQRRIETLTDQFNNKRIGKGQLTSGIKGVLSNLGITGASASAILGPLGGDTVQALVKGITEQAGAIAGGPQRAGNGLLPSITRPLQTLEQTTRQINQLRHEEFLKEHDEQKKQTKLLTDIANGKRADAFTSSLSKNPGSASKRTQKLTGATR